MIKIIFNKDKNKSVAYDDNIQVGECDYIETEKEWNIIHTEVDKKYQGQGIAKKLVEAVIYNARENGKNIIAECSYAKKILTYEQTN